ARGTWSPDSQRLAYYANACQDWCGSYVGHFSMKYDGSDVTSLPGSLTWRSWSPDGAKFVGQFNGGVSIMNTDGSGQVELASNAASPDWQPILRGYARPKAATPM